MEVRVLSDIEEVIAVGLEPAEQKAWIRVKILGDSRIYQLVLPMRQLIVLSEKMMAATEAAEREIESSGGGIR